MGMPALKFEFEEVMVEERLARLEANVEHIQSDVSELKGHIQRLDNKIDSVKDSVTILSLTVQKMVTRLILWGVACFAALLATMARGFHWL
jgi:uncharacterized protein YlxW (UPF0749 family)